MTFDPAAPAGAKVVAIDQFASLRAVECPSANRCVALQKSLNTEDSRIDVFDPTALAPVTPVSIGALGYLEELSCPAANQCSVATREGQVATFDPAAPGAPVVSAVVPGTVLTAIDCPTTAQCTVVDAAAHEVTFEPASGAVNAGGVKTIDPGERLGVTACPLASQCSTLVGDGKVVTWKPATGAVRGGVRSIDGDRRLNGLACPTEHQCTTVDDKGSVVTFDPAGPGREREDLAVGLDFFGGACPSVTLCVWTANDRMVVTFNPRSPAGATVAKLPGTAYSGIACPSTSLCVASTGLAVLVFDPKRPQDASSTKLGLRGRDQGSFYSPACPAADQCTVIGVSASGAPEARTFDPDKPGTPPTISLDVVERIGNGLTCPATTQCVFQDGTGKAASFNPRSGAKTEVSTIATGTSIQDIVCVSVARCVAVDMYGSGYTTGFDASDAEPPVVTVGGKPSVKQSGSTFAVNPGIKVGCAAGGERCKVAVTAKAGGKKIGAATLTIKPGKSAAVGFKLNAKGAALLRKNGKLVTKVKVATPGAATVTKTITMKLQG